MERRGHGERAGHHEESIGQVWRGRDGDLRAAAGVLARSPVVTLVGPGGIGKTQLALTAARTAAAGHGWPIGLAEISSPADVPRAVADAIGVAQRPGRTLAQSIVAVLRSSRALLVVDNRERALAARTLVTGAADKIAATIRHGSDPAPAPVRQFDDRAALIYMRDVLVELSRLRGRPSAG